MSNAVARSVPRHAAFPRAKRGATGYVDLGAGEAVVLIHGVGLNADAWGPQIADLAKSHRVIAIDMLGHGASERPSPQVTLQDYVEAVAQLFADLKIAKANVIGHSMGGLVALGFAVAHPSKTLRLGVFNSVYRRSAKRRAAVEQRASEILTSGTLGNVEQPMERWFGERKYWPEAAFDVEYWLRSADPVGYGLTYSIFAKSDEAFVGQLNALPMPALFATGSLDQNSSPEMAKAMAAETVAGTALVIEGARHMMNLTHVSEVNASLRQLLEIPLANIDTKDLRRAFGTFLTGVTVVTMRQSDGTLRGFTANSFSSVSLEPPLLLVCLNKASASCAAFGEGAGFAVNILSDAQKDISGNFASRSPDKFANIDYSLSARGNPIIGGSTAWFDCARHRTIDAGDHVILIGRVESYAHTSVPPLGYGRGGYFNLALEQTALNAVAQSGKVVVGAILEVDGRLLAFIGKGNKYVLPTFTSHDQLATSKALVAQLQKSGIGAQLDFLFSVFEDPTTQTHYIFYRGVASLAPDASAELLEFDNGLPLRFDDVAVQIMIRRYAAERLEGRYKIYTGDHISGEVRELNDKGTGR